MERKNVLQQMCVGVYFILLFAAIDVFPPTEVEKPEKPKNAAPILSVGKQNCVDKMGLVK